MDADDDEETEAPPEFDCVGTVDVAVDRIVDVAIDDRAVVVAVDVAEVVEIISRGVVVADPARDTIADPFCWRITSCCSSALSFS